MSESTSTRRSWWNWGSRQDKTTSKLFRLQDDYLLDRVQFKINAYATKARRYRWWYWILASVAGIGSLSMPVLVNYQGLSRLWPTIISLLVATSVALQNVIHPREHWRNYDSISSVLREEEMRFSTGTAPYATETKMNNEPKLVASTASQEGSREEAYSEVDHQSRFNKFVERVEEAIAKERAETIVMRTASPADGKK